MAPTGQQQGPDLHCLISSDGLHWGVDIHLQSDAPSGFEKSF